MSRHFGFGSLIVCLVLFTSGGAEALTLLSSTRTVLADTSYDIFPTTSDADQDGETRTDPGAWIGAGVAASGLVNIAQATAEATQDSTVTTTDPFTELLVSGGGAAGAAFDVNDPGFASRAQGFGTTSIEVVFDITTPKLVALAVSLLADLDELRLDGGEHVVLVPPQRLAQLVALRPPQRASRVGRHHLLHVGHERLERRADLPLAKDEALGRRLPLGVLLLRLLLRLLLHAAPSLLLRHAEGAVAPSFSPGWQPTGRVPEVHSGR